MANTVDKVISIALNEVDYLEKSAEAVKKNPAVLDSKTAGAGKDNYTKYGRDMHKLYPKVMDEHAAWCDAFVDWCFQKAYGVSNAKAMLGGNFDDYTVNSKGLYVKKKAYYKIPRVGDQVFFTNGTRVYHTGLVYDVDLQYIYTIEGNTSSTSGVVENGGSVRRKKYARTNPKIDGYGRPNYDYSKTLFLSDVHELLGAYENGSALLRTITISRTENKTNPLVTPLERYMKCLGYYSGSIEADMGKTPSFGNGMEAAIKQFQKEVVKASEKNQDGIITARKATWKKLLSN